jgi:hypothetical protein
MYDNATSSQNENSRLSGCLAAFGRICRRGLSPFDERFKLGLNVK